MYFEIAVAVARAEAQRVAPAVDTHWNTYDAPISRGEQLAACRSYVSLRRFSAEPTCAACRQQQAIYNAMEF